MLRYVVLAVAAAACYVMVLDTMSRRMPDLEPAAAASGPATWTPVTQRPTTVAHDSFIRG